MGAIESLRGKVLYRATEDARELRRPGRWWSEDADYVDDWVVTHGAPIVLSAYGTAQNVLRAGRFYSGGGDDAFDYDPEFAGRHMTRLASILNTIDGSYDVPTVSFTIDGTQIHALDLDGVPIAGERLAFLVPPRLRQLEVDPSA